MKIIKKIHLLERKINSNKFLRYWIKYEQIRNILVKISLIYLYTKNDYIKKDWGFLDDTIEFK
jgi:hypothetical protein